MPGANLAPAGTIAGAVLFFAGVRQSAGELVPLLAGCVLVGLFVVNSIAIGLFLVATLGSGALAKARS